jgi:hypothetical protein
MIMHWLTALVLLAAPIQPEVAEAPTVKTATFSMYCYWTGEATVGRVEGVVASRIGHWGGGEIVQVDYDPRLTDLGKLAGALKRERSFYLAIVTSDAERSEAAHHLDVREIAVRAGEPHFIPAKHTLRIRHPELYELNLSESQAILLNSWSYFGGSMPDVLTPEQKRRLETAKRN